MHMDASVGGDSHSGDSGATNVCSGASPNFQGKSTGCFVCFFVYLHDTLTKCEKFFSL